MKERKTIIKECFNCINKFNADLREHNRGNAKFCSRKCFGEYKSKKLKEHFKEINKPNVKCSYCNKKFYKNSSRMKLSKSGLFFCSRKHKDLAQTLEFGCQEIQPGHYDNGLHSYRDIALRQHENKCNRCNYNKFPGVLVVHHKDRDRTNNKSDNLEILCPTCHAIEHYLAKDGLYNKRN